MSVERFYFLYSLDSQRVLFGAVGKHEPHQVSEDIFFYKVGSTFCYLYSVAIVRETLQGVKVGVELVVKAAF